MELIKVINNISERVVDDLKTKFPDYSKVYEFVHNLNWTHIRRLLSVVNPEVRI